MIFSQENERSTFHVRTSGHFKTYINPCLNSLSDSNLGFWIGPICVTSVCVAYDTYALSSTPSGLQGALDIVSHYGKRYQLTINADKTKIVISGTKIDMQFYQDTHGNLMVKEYQLLRIMNILDSLYLGWMKS